MKTIRQPNRWLFSWTLSIGIGLTATGAMLLGSSQVVAQTMPHQSNFESIGTVNCTSSTCHGSVDERTATPVLQNEYTTWLRQDPHTQAYNVLLNEQSKRIAKNLGLPQAAHQSSECLDCHAHNAPVRLRGERVTLTDGVNCEACHGPAGKWVKTHIEPNPSHQKNIDNGLYPTDNPKAVAKLCVSCHQGDATRPITHRIMGAGHPRISIELDTFMALEPPHYRIDDDWRKRKGAYDSSKLWAMGQIVSSANLLDLIADNKRNSQGLMPEFMMFDCHACHATMKSKDWQKGMAAAPGQPRINDSSLLMVGAINKALAADKGAAFQTALNNLHIAATSPASSLPNLVSAAKDMRIQVQATERMVIENSLNANALTTIFKGVINLANQGELTDYAGAEQAYMTISSLANALSNRGSELGTKVNPSLRRMLALLSNDDAFNRNQFQAELASLKQIAGE